MSAIWCGCDREANYQCRRHYGDKFENELVYGGVFTAHPAELLCGVELDLSSVGTGAPEPPASAPTRATTLPDVPTERKQYPVATGVLDYFPDAIVAVAHVSYVGNEQHNPGEPLHWARGKSMDQSDTMIRHYLQRGTRDKDGQRHSAKMVWRALAILQLEIEQEGQ